MTRLYGRGQARPYKTGPRPPKTSLLDWQPLPAEIDDIQREFYTTGDQEMNMARAVLHRKGIVPKVSLSGPCAQQLKKMSVAQPGKKKKKKFVIHRVNPEHMACAAFVELTNAHTDGTLLYTGESPGAIMNKAFEEEMRPTKRQEIPPKIREELRASQQGR